MHNVTPFYHLFYEETRAENGDVIPLVHAARRTRVPISGIGSRYISDELRFARIRAREIYIPISREGTSASTSTARNGMSVMLIAVIELGREMGY